MATGWSKGHEMQQWFPSRRGKSTSGLISFLKRLLLPMSVHTHKPGLLSIEPWGRGKMDDFLSVETFFGTRNWLEKPVKTQSFASIYNRVGSRPGGRETSAECVRKPVSSSITVGGLELWPLTGHLPCPQNPYETPLMKTGSL